MADLATVLGIVLFVALFMVALLPAIIAFNKSHPYKLGLLIANFTILLVAMVLGVGGASIAWVILLIVSLYPPSNKKGKFVVYNRESHAEGKSAYDIWLELGNVGSKEDFLNSLKGPKGEKGDRGSTVYPEPLSKAGFIKRDEWDQ